MRRGPVGCGLWLLPAVRSRLARGRRVSERCIVIRFKAEMTEQMTAKHDALVDEVLARADTQNPMTQAEWEERLDNMNFAFTLKLDE